MNASGAFGHVSTREPLGDLILRMPGGTPKGAKMANRANAADPPAGRASSSGYTATVKTRGALALLLPYGDVNTDQKEVTPPTGGDPYIRLWVQPGLKPPKFGRRPRCDCCKLQSSCCKKRTHWDFSSALGARSPSTNGQGRPKAAPAPPVAPAAGAKAPQGNTIQEGSILSWGAR